MSGPYPGGSLWRRVVETTARGLQAGAIERILTQCAFIDQGGVNFLVRIVSSLERKDSARREQAQKAAAQKADVNPFLPYEADLFVADVSETHVCLLNKFNVLEHHLLIVTRAYEDQEQLLTLQDFQALWTCMLAFEGLGFYNGGAVAGASQPHKHLQMVPLPLAPSGPAIPMEPLLDTARVDFDSTGAVPGLPFAHAFVRLDRALLRSPERVAEASLTRYMSMLHALGLAGRLGGNDARQAAPYNLLVTRDWMLLVPRSAETVDGISINALGFAGALLVRDAQQLDALQAMGPMDALMHVGLASGAAGLAQA